ncbi:hypothetical protein ACFL43_07380 [Thermodesulfobacteriota bacterium]
MSEEYTFPPYGETLQKMIDQFGGEKMETYKGRDVTPLWELKGGPLLWSYKYLYKVPKLEKISFTVQSFRDKLMSFATMIWPDDEHALPVYSSFWAESAKGSYFIIDLYPTADCICDIPYMEKYLEPLEPYYDEGKKHFPDISGRDPNWFRAMVSPYYVNADFHPSTKETQDRLLKLTTDYLQVYYELWQKEEPSSPEYMQRLNERREALRQNMFEKDPGGFMVEQAVGKELAELSLMALF